MIELSSNEIFGTNEFYNYKSNINYFNVIVTSRQAILIFIPKCIFHSIIANEIKIKNALITKVEFNVKLSGILVDLSDEKDYIELRVNNEYKYYNFKLEEKNVADIFTSNTLFLSKKDGKYGFLDKAGNIVVEYIYDDATEQNRYGYAGVKKDGKWGAIDNKGTLVQEPTYKLDDYLKIDFIGRWHYGKDINMNYYNQMEQ